MAPPTTLKVTNRSGSKLKKLPTSIEIADTTTVQDVKNKLGKLAGVSPERLGLSEPEKRTTLKDKKELVSRHKQVMAGQEILVKDLGPQISWTTVFIVEYLGPILIHLSFLFIRPYIYSNPAPLSNSQYLCMAMVVLHFLKREYETLFVHKFSLSTMPAMNIFKNSFHYWVFSGLNLAYWVYKPTSLTAKSSPMFDNLNIIGVVLYVLGEVGNLLTHITLSNLRKPGDTARAIPKGFGFGTVTSPNYSFELLAWAGVGLVTKSWSAVLFWAVAYGQMRIWAQKKERSLRADFGSKYQKKRNGIIPGPWAKL
ncbi:hypothetical protein HYALB_00007282 [Hymenoscyphus albidus]|uniref:3-oxo-5-alpha-steroid 4-dehydrogenase C-terminal domain-containing protein n=1 Tax=Hymenoscyphus albidus TaxID=595503 RepID=A0A9N9M3U7_9HELO|nr:hypothetical protein HYALB_00007282 [Hymenoscyphus albidus]